MKCRRRALAVVIVVWITVLHGPSEAEGIFVGSCALELRVRYSPSVGLVPSATAMTFDGSGTCVVNGALAPIAVAGSAATNPATGGIGCAVGSAAFGTATVQVATPGFPNPLVQVLVTRNGNAVTVLAWSLVLKFEGVGTFVRDTDSTAVCLTGGSVAVERWLGTLSFQDPTFVP